MESKVLVVSYGYLGDIIFSTSLADKLKKMGYDKVDYSIGFKQVSPLVRNNPDIDTLFTSPDPTIKYLPPNKELVDGYDKVIELGPLSFKVAPTIEYQQHAEIPEEEQSSEYRIYTVPSFDEAVSEYVDKLRQQYGKKIVCVMNGWKEKTYLFTKEQYGKGVDVPNKGYGGENRDIQKVVDALAKEYTLIPVGLVSGISQSDSFSIPFDHPKSISAEASLIKHCDAFLGTEGGLANIAGGVGTKTLLSGDFTHQLYGWNGVIKKIEGGAVLGPDKYFPDAGHVMFDPYLTDEELIEAIKKEL